MSTWKIEDTQIVRIPPPKVRSGPVGPGGEPVHDTEDTLDKDNEKDKPKVEPGSPEPDEKVPSVEDIRNKIRKAKGATEEARRQQQRQRTDQRGEGPGGLDDIALKELEPTVNYKQLLKNIIQRTRTKTDWRRFSRRGLATGNTLFKSKQNYELKEIVIAFDTSGSIDVDQASRIGAEIGGIIRSYPHVSLQLVMWHTEVYFDKSYDGPTAQQIKNDIVRHFESGGTLLSSVANYLAKNYKKEPKAVIYFTDGWIESNPKLFTKAQNFYLIVEGGTDKITSQLPGKSFKISA
jgi:predicted metal-dependent peptidase